MYLQLTCPTCGVAAWWGCGNNILTNHTLCERGHVVCVYTKICIQCGCVVGVWYGNNILTNHTLCERGHIVCVYNYRHIKLRQVEHNQLTSACR